MQVQGVVPSQIVRVAVLAQTPKQQGWSTAQAWFVGTQYVAGGTSHAQVPPGGHAVRWVPDVSVTDEKHRSPSQQPASFVHAWACAPQVFAARQVPFEQLSAESQHGVVTEHAPPVCAQEGAGPELSQVPLVAPDGMAQPSPLQQSAPVVQAPPDPRHGSVHLPASHVLEQQSPLAVHAAPFAEHWTGGSFDEHFQPVSMRYVQGPLQQVVSLAPSHVVPVSLHAAAAVQRSTPAPSGTQGSPPQHWSLNWQMLPVAMQQAGFAES
jgi:hypothetical protein